MVGDTIYDALACRGAGVGFLGVLSGGHPRMCSWSGGLRGLARSRHLYADLDPALEVASLAADASH